jgi:exodeoxyribonuclease VII large subunit
MPSLFDLPFESPPDPPERAAPPDGRPSVPAPGTTAPATRQRAGAPTPARPAAATRPPVAPDSAIERPATPAAATRHIYDVSSLLADVKRTLADDFTDVWVEGELTDVRVIKDHLYFALKDGLAQVKCVMWRSDRRTLAFAPEHGQKVLVRGSMSLYDVRGDLQLYVSRMEPQGLGALQQAIEQVKRRLAADGLLDPARKRPLPPFPRTIGLVTSLDAAALRDLLKVIYTRAPRMHVVISPARVQGDAAAASIVAALARLTAHATPDLVIVARGGGSLEDLMAFNHDAVARAIAACPVPVVSGVGHESDITIADLVADVRAATPSHAAELVVRPTREITAAIRERASRLKQLAFASLRAAEVRLRRLERHTALVAVPMRVANLGRDISDAQQALARALHQQLADARGHIRQAQHRLDAYHPQRRLQRAAVELGNLDARLQAVSATRLAADRAALTQRAGRLAALSPLAVLGRGYAICWSDDHQTLIRAADAALVGERVHVRVADGELHCDVAAVSGRAETDR